MEQLRIIIAADRSKPRTEWRRHHGISFIAANTDGMYNDIEFFCQFSNRQFAILCSTEQGEALKNALEKAAVPIVLDSIPVSSVFSIKNSVNN